MENIAVDLEDGVVVQDRMSGSGSPKGMKALATVANEAAYWAVAAESGTGVVVPDILQAVGSRRYPWKVGLGDWDDA